LLALGYTLRMHLQLRERQSVYTGKKVALEIHHYDDLDTGRRVSREVVRHPGAVVILPMLDAKTIVLIRNRRFAIEADLIELPAGTLNPSEPPIDCAGRELEEETGYLAGRLVPLGSFFASPGILTEKLYAFVATGLEKSQQQLDEGEQIEPLITSMEEAIEMVKDGRIQDAKSIATLMLWKLKHG
jgi:ADP-ribose pyrophosphatase